MVFLKACYRKTIKFCWKNQSNNSRGGHGTSKKYRSTSIWYIMKIVSWYRFTEIKCTVVLRSAHLSILYCQITKHSRLLANNKSFSFPTDGSKPSRLRRLKSGVYQRFVLASPFFKIQIYDLPPITFIKFAYVYIL